MAESPFADLPRVTVLMGTLNGAAHLKEQLESIASQRGVDWSLWVSDDGSVDDTRKIVEEFRRSHPGRDIRLLDGPQQGAAANYLWMLSHPGLPDGYVALSDQDDVWLPEKLEWALQMMAPREGRGPVVYAGSFAVLRPGVRTDVKKLGPLHRPDVGNAAVQNILPGHSIVLNVDAVALLRRFPPPAAVAFHDWWIYLFMVANEAHCLLDRRPVVLYRQHEANLLGSSRGLLGGLRRFQLLFSRTYADWSHNNLELLLSCGAPISPRARAIASALTGSGPKWGARRVLLMARLKIFRQSTVATIFLYAAAFVGRV